MAETNYGFMEVLTGKPLQETAKFASSSYLSNKYFDSYCAMANLFSSFSPVKWRIISSIQTFSLAALENYYWFSESVIATICPYFEFVWTYFRGFLVR